MVAPLTGSAARQGNVAPTASDDPTVESHLRSDHVDSTTVKEGSTFTGSTVSLKDVVRGSPPPPAPQVSPPRSGDVAAAYASLGAFLKKYRIPADLEQKLTHETPTPIHRDEPKTPGPK